MRFLGAALVLVLMFFLWWVSTKVIKASQNRQDRRAAQGLLAPEALPPVAQRYHALSERSVTLLRGLIRDDDNLQGVFRNPEEKKEAQSIVDDFVHGGGKKK